MLQRGGWLAERYDTAWPFLHTPWLVGALLLFQYGLYRRVITRDRSARAAAG